MAPPQPDRKRPRLAEDTEEKALSNHPSLYYDDGNVVLSCGSTLFRVHRSLLARHSSVFRDLFEPGMDKKQDFLRGCLHVTVDDTKEEMEAVLNTIYDGLRVDFAQLTVETFPALSNTLRMTTKYNLERPREEILNRIREEWPFALEKHDSKMGARRMQHMRLSPFVIQGGKIVPNPAFDPAVPQGEDIVVHPAGVIALLRECKCTDPHLYAPLFYALSRDTWQFGGLAIGHHVAPLTHADIERFIVGVERLRNHYEAHVAHCPPFPLTPPHVQACLPGIRLYWADLAAALLGRTMGVRQPIEDWKDLIALACVQPQFAAYMICVPCSRMIIAEMQAARRRLWSQLPTFFELL